MKGTKLNRHGSKAMGQFSCLAARRTLVPALGDSSHHRAQAEDAELTTKLKAGESVSGCDMSCCLSDHVAATYRLLEPGPTRYLEVNAFHPDYRPGRENFEHNRERDSWPRLAYVSTETEFLRFVRQYASERMVCCGLNPRTEILRNSAGYLRPARESEVPEGRALMLDLDPADSAAPDPEALGHLLEAADQYFSDLRLLPPARGRSGRGVHLVSVYSPIPVAEHKDLKSRIRRFSEGFEREMSDRLMQAGLKLDSTYDLRRLVKVYGTAKPGGVVSRLERPGSGADQGLRDYLLSLDSHPRVPVDEMPGCRQLNIGAAIPSWFPELLEDQRVADLWHGRGKPKSLDCTRSGYDFSLVRLLLAQGYREPDDLATILALRPDGAFRNRRSDRDYLAKTIEQAFASLGKSANKR
jgi:hypothetical protein